MSVIFTDNSVLGWRQPRKDYHRLIRIFPEADKIVGQMESGLIVVYCNLHEFKCLS